MNLLIIVLNVFFLAPPPKETGVLQNFSTGQVNWTTLTLQAKGIGKPDLNTTNAVEARLKAEDAAKTTALAAALKILLEIPLKSQQKVSLPSDYALQKYQVVETKYFNDNRVEVTLQIPLYGALLEKLLPEVGKTKFREENSTYTGVIINAKGLSVKPALAPRLLNSQGDAIYTAEMISAFALQQRGVALYVKSLNQALENERAGDKPMLLKAVRLFDAHHIDIVIADQEAQRLQNANVLNDGRVIIVVDE